MQQQILDAYQRQRADKNGVSPELTAKDMEVAKLAASYSSSELRQATVMRASLEREEWKAEQKKRQSKAVKR